MALNISRLPTRVRNRQPTKPPNFHPFETITAYVDDGLPLAQAVDQIAEPVEEAFESSELRWITLTGTWGAFNSYTAQIPHQHSSHSLMANLFVALRTRSTPPRPVPYQGDLWRDMPIWQPSFYVPWGCPTMSVRGATARQVDRDSDTLGFFGGREGIRRRYMNGNAFMARLVILEDAPNEIEVYALAALRWGLESDRDTEGYDLDVPGAAMWMLYAAEHIFKSERERIEAGEDMVGLELQPHPWWNNDRGNGFSRERWDLWKSRFSAIFGIDDLSAETKELAQKAIVSMERAEAL